MLAPRKLIQKVAVKCNSERFDDVTRMIFLFVFGGEKMVGKLNKSKKNVPGHEHRRLTLLWSGEKGKNSKICERDDS